MSEKQERYSDAIYKYYILLLRAALDGTATPPLPDDVSYRDIYMLSSSGSMTHVIYEAISGFDLPDEVRKAFEQQYIKMISRDVIQRTAYADIIDALTSAGVTLLPLKGCIFKYFYPNTAMRRMSDMDIVYDAGGENDKVRQIMSSLGYKCVEWDKGHHDIFHQEPILNIELHRRVDYPSYWDECIHIPKPDKDNRLFLRHSPEDIYVLFLKHAAKHMKSGGVGVRTICDLHMLKKNFGDEIMTDAVADKLSKYGITTFAAKLNATEKKWFYADELSLDLADLAVLNGSTYGSGGDTELVMAAKKRSKFGYFISRIFPGYKTIRDQYRILYKFPFLLPIFWVVRAVGVLFDPKRRVTAKYLGQTLKADDARIDEFNEIRREFGIDEFDFDPNT